MKWQTLFRPFLKHHQNEEDAKARMLRTLEFEEREKYGLKGHD
jgi:hypothetical protein